MLNHKWGNNCDSTAHNQGFTWKFIRKHQDASGAFLSLSLSYFLSHSHGVDFVSPNSPQHRNEFPEINGTLRPSSAENQDESRNSASRHHVFSSLYSVFFFQWLLYFLLILSDTCVLVCVRQSPFVLMHCLGVMPFLSGTQVFALNLKQWLVYSRTLFRIVQQRVLVCLLV